MNLASLMAHEDADTSRKVKKSQKQGGNDAKEGKSRKKRSSQPENVKSVWNDEGKAGSRISQDLNSMTVVGMSVAPSKHLKTESESMHIPNRMNVLVATAQDLDEDYDNI